MDILYFYLQTLATLVGRKWKYNPFGEKVLVYIWASLVTQMVKNPPAMQETWIWSLGWEDPLEKGMAAHSSILAWKIPWTEEPSSQQSMGSQSQTQLSYHPFPFQTVDFRGGAWYVIHSCSYLCLSWYFRWNGNWDFEWAISGIFFLT